MKEIRIGLLGCGTIGAGVVKLLRRNAAILESKLGARLRLVGVAELRTEALRAAGLGLKMAVSDPRAFVVSDDVDLIVELFGGYEPAGSLILRALQAGKDVVTANKALLAERGAEIFRMAARFGAGICFEASVGGGIPIIRALRESLAGDRHRSVYGIVNGTCNSILTMMSEQGQEFDDALAEAKRVGLAEANPSLDIDGHDAAHKLCLLAALAFGVTLTPAQVYTEGIGAVTQTDIACARELGYAIKLLAIAKDEDGAIEARVHPTMVPQNDLLASVGGAFNAINVHSEALGSTMYFGLGAGEMPTATAVVGDILELARRRLTSSVTGFHPLGYPTDLLRKARVKPMGGVVCECYLRFMVDDRPGVLGSIASVLGRHGISIASVIQQGRGKETTVPVIMRTHDAPERNLMRALGAIRRLKMVRTRPVFIRIEDRLQAAIGGSDGSQKP